MFGVGGGIILIPILTGSFRLTQHQAHGTSLTVIGATAVASLLVYGTHGNVLWLSSLTLGLASLITAGIGARLATRTSPTRLTQAFGIFLIVIGIRMLMVPSHPGAGVVPHHGLPGIAFDVGLGLVTGLVSGYMGIGGGGVVVPAMTLLVGLSQQMAQGTSLAMMMFTAPAGAIEHARHGNVIARMVPGLSIGAFVGAPLASWLAQRLPHALLTRGFALFLITNGVLTALRAARKLRLERAARATSAAGA